MYSLEFALDAPVPAWQSYKQGKATYAECNAQYRARRLERKFKYRSFRNEHGHLEHHIDKFYLTPETAEKAASMLLAKTGFKFNVEECELISI